MTMNTADRWGTVPGAFDSSFTEKLVINSYTDIFDTTKLLELQRLVHEEGYSGKEIANAHILKYSGHQDPPVNITVERTMSPDFG
jgi:hypothetical protein